MKKGPHKTSITPLFRLVGLPQKVTVEVNEHTYEVDTKHVTDNWLYPAFRAFQELNYRLTAEHKIPNTFVTIGTGPGIDAIGAAYILQPKQLIITDIHPEVLALAQKNVAFNTTIPCMALQGSLCAPLREQSLHADVIYANLPNIPFSGGTTALLVDQLTSSFFDGKKIRGVSAELSKYLLAMQYSALLSARECLAPGGSLLLNIGGRVPFHLIERMCAEAGYACEELCVMFKAQSQPELIVKGYAEAEVIDNVEFDFYVYDDAVRVANQYSHRVSTHDLKQALSKYRVSATEAWNRYTDSAERIGHIVHVIRAVVQ